jgi:hypothetical protein
MTEPSQKRVRRVGHKGAAHIEHGIDVLSENPDGSGRLLVAHDYEDVRERTPLTIDQALEHLTGGAFAEIELNVDIKLPRVDPAHADQRDVSARPRPDPRGRADAAPRLVGAARAS